MLLPHCSVWPFSTSRLPDLYDMGGSGTCQLEARDRMAKFMCTQALQSNSVNLRLTLKDSSSRSVFSKWIMKALNNWSSWISCCGSLVYSQALGLAIYTPPPSFPGLEEHPRIRTRKQNACAMYFSGYWETQTLNTEQQVKSRVFLPFAHGAPWALETRSTVTKHVETHKVI